MKVKHYAIAPLDPNTPSLTPEAMAASAARTSRNAEGIDEIVKLIDPQNLNASAKRIFELADYGHVSIKGLTGGVALFLEDLSLWQIYDLFRVCSCSDGQETSTRYVSFEPEKSVDGKLIGFDIPVYDDMLAEASVLYKRLSEFWGNLAKERPQLLGLPRAQIEAAAAGDVKAQKLVDRLTRNYVFDRARVVIPMTALNNMVLIQTARQWVETAAYLNSCPRQEARDLGQLVVEQLALAIPNLLKHSQGSPEQAQQLLADMDLQRVQTDSDHPIEEWNQEDAVETSVWQPDQPQDRGMWGSQEFMNRSFVGHGHRYIPVGEQIGRCAVRFRIKNLGLAELRDLNRHRPGHKFAWSAPVGVYAAFDQVPDNLMGIPQVVELFAKVVKFLTEWSNYARERLMDGDPNYPYFYFLGTQLDFEHLTTLDKFIYTAEIRTGPGVHYRYCAQVRACLHQVYDQLPWLKGHVLEGQAEPE